MRTKLFLTVAALLGGAALAVAQTTHSGLGDDMDHSTHAQSQPTQVPVLTEPGQGAFAALSEVVHVLESDLATDWSQVDLLGLRMHLVDMDRVISDTVVTDSELPNGLSTFATGDTETIAALRRMVPAHAAQLAMDDRWEIVASETATGVELRVTSSDPETVARIKGLGFFGLMASQDHHREHHLMMALGKDTHVH